MLRKRTGYHQKDQMMSSGSDSYSQSDFSGHNNHKTNSLFGIPGLFVGLSNKGLSDYDSVWSPTSPLDLRMFSNIRNPFAKSPRSPKVGRQKDWGSSKVGLSIVNSLEGNTKPSAKTMHSLDSKNILFGPGMRIKNPKCQNKIETFQAHKSLPKDYLFYPQTLFNTPPQNGNHGVVFEIGDNPPLKPHQFGKILSCSLDSCVLFPVHSGTTDSKVSWSLGNICFNATSPATSPLKPSSEDSNSNNFFPKPSLGSLGSSNGFTDLLSASEIELSEDYTCVTSHGPNPKTTHIYGNHVLKRPDDNVFGSFHKNEKQITKPPFVHPSDDFLSFCHACNKKLEEGKDIYIYRGEKAFCSFECRSREILNDEKTEEKAKSPKNSSTSDNGQELFEVGVVFTT